MMTTPSQGQLIPPPTPPISSFGLHQLRRGRADTTIIFVHGILSDSDSAWGAPSWPSLMLGESEFEAASIYVFTYRTGLMSRTYSISDCTEALREQFYQFDIWNQEKIVFVCHSMGGIVVRRFLVANQVRLGNANAILGLFLVASPSLGARDANLLSVLSYAFQHTQAAILRFAQSNTTLDDINRDFRTLLNGGILRIVGRELIEDRPIKIKRWLGLSRQVVQPFSASAFFHDEGYEPLKIPGSDHSSIVKPVHRNAMQHQALLRLLRGVELLAAANLAARTSTSVSTLVDSDEAAHSLTRQPAYEQRQPGNELVIRAALSTTRKSDVALPLGDEGLEVKAAFCLDLRGGRMIERMLATALLRKHADPGGLLMASAERAVSERQFELIAPWLRLVPESGIADKAAKLFEEKFQPDFVDKTRMRARMLGWAGERLYPNVDWNDRYCQEKFSFTYSQAYAYAAWSDQDEMSLRSIVGYLINRHANYATHYEYEIHLFEWIRAFNGVPVSNARILLNEMINRQAPSSMLIALLAKMSIEPTRDAASDLARLFDHDDPHVRDQALETLAFLPAQSQVVRELKSTLLTRSSIGDAISAGVDLRFNAVQDLGALVAREGPGKATYFAAWSLAQMANHSAEASRYLGLGAMESADKLTRAICIVGLAASGATKAAGLIEAEFADSRDVERFCLLLARSYTENITPLFAFLAETSEDRVYVPFMLACFQRMFRDAVGHASEHAPILKELLSLTDDI